jgi:two-component system, cell cycle response regulator DivK
MTIVTRILLVEDNENNRDMLSRRLQKKGYQVSIAIDGAEAVSLTDRERPDLVLMDMSLPIMSGADATRAIRGNDAIKGTPILALTASAMNADREIALAAGCDDYDTKPVDLPRLLDKIEALLGERR